jgi:hypothetical protein
MAESRIELKNIIPSNLMSKIRSKKDLYTVLEVHCIIFFNLQVVITSWEGNILP